MQSFPIRFEISINKLSLRDGVKETLLSDSNNNELFNYKFGNGSADEILIPLVHKCVAVIGKAK